ncbi:MAG: spore coat protein GerQ [Bacilli bacterium]|nr:spore coat protein GerQ [bacterium]MDY3757627.1 spore coat protein GerQ [Bacilli bacterium]
MNGAYYPNANYQGDMNLNNAPIGNDVDNEQSYIENILRLNKGKRAKAYFSFPDSNTWRDKIFEGIIEEAGKDHLVMSDPKTGKWQLILLIYLNFVEFDEKIVYNHSYSEITY